MSSTAERDSPAYALPYANNMPEETKRLDDMHEGIKDYLGGSLSFAPLEHAAPKAVLELGCGSGAWAIQAAKTFPDAEVLAVDVAPIPRRDLPQNMRFQSLDVTEPFPFEPGAFDIVHVRMVLAHLCKFENVLSRIIQLVGPGGWLLLEDVDRVMYDTGGLGPGQKTFWKAFQSRMRHEKLNPRVGSAFEGLLKASGSFREVNVKKVCAPISRESSDRKTSKLGATLRNSMHRAIQMLSENPNALGLTVEVGKAARAEMNDPMRNLHWDMYFTWSRRRT